MASETNLAAQVDTVLATKMLASKYADTESSNPVETSESLKASTKPSPTESKPLPLPPSADEKFDWADEPMEPPMKVHKPAAASTLNGSQQTTPSSEKRVSRTKSTTQVPSVIATQDENKLVTPAAEKRHVRTKSSVQTPTMSTPAEAQTNSVPVKSHSRSKSSFQLPTTGGLSTPSTASPKRKKPTTNAGPLVDLAESAQEDYFTTSPKQSDLSAKRDGAKTSSGLVAPVKPDPTSQAKPSTPDLVRSTSTVASTTFFPVKKMMSRRGRPCVIRVPREGESEEFRRHPWSREQYESRLATWIEDGHNVNGYDQSLEDTSKGHVNTALSQNCELYPNPEDQADEKRLSKEQGRFDIVIPDKRKWDAYMNQMMEDKLKALGVKPAGEDEPTPALAPAQPSSTEMSRQGSTSFPGLANSPPPLSSSVNSQHQWQAGLPFSAPSFSPAAFTNNTSIGGVGSPGPSGVRPGHLSRQSTFGMPFSSPNINPALGINQALQQQFPHQVFSGNSNPPSQSGTPLPGALQRMPSGLNRASPDMFGFDRSQTQTPKMQPLNFRTASGFGLQRRGTLLSEHSSVVGEDQNLQGNQQARNISTPDQSWRTRQATYGELAYPTPRGHRQNISQNLEREAESEQYYPGEYVNSEKIAEDARRRAGSNATKAPQPTAPRNQPHQAVPSHTSKASSSAFNVDAKEFKFQPKPDHAKAPSITKNPFMPVNAAAAASTKAAVSLLTAHANGGTTGGSTFNVTAPAFQPPGQGTFDFSSRIKPSIPKEETAKADDSEKIFQGINVTEEIVKPPKKSKAIPIVRPSPETNKKQEDSEYHEDEMGRLGQNSDRFKRSKPTMLDGQNEPKFDLPNGPSAVGKPAIPTTMPRLDSKIDEKDSDFDEGDKEPWHDFAMDATHNEKPEPSKPERPVKSTYVPPHKRKTTVQEIVETDVAAPRPAVAEATQKLAEAVSAESQPAPTKSPKPSDDPESVSPTYQEIDAIMENLNGEPDFGAQQDVDQRLPAPVKSPVKKDQPVGDSPELRASNLTAFQRVASSQSPIVSSDWLRDQQQSMRTSTSPVRKLVGNKDAQISDWDDMLDSGDESKLIPHAQFFDTRVKSLIEGVLQQHLNPLQKSIKDVDVAVKATSRGLSRAAATDKTDSDADDEDNADEAQPSRKGRRTDKKLEQIRSIVNEAIKPLAMGNTALPDASEIRAMITDGLKDLDNRKDTGLKAEQVHSIVKEAVAPLQAAASAGLDIEQMKLVVAESVKAFGPPPAPALDHERIRSLVAETVKSSIPARALSQPAAPALDQEAINSIVVEAVKSSVPKPSHSSEFDPENMKMVVAETIKAFGASASMELEQMRSIVTESIKASMPAQNPTIEPEQMHNIVSEAMKTVIPSSAPAPEFDPEHMRLVVAETIKAFGVASSSMDPEQIRSVVTDAIKASTPAAEPAFDPEHMKLVVSETIKAFGGPAQPFEPEHVREVVLDAVKASAPAPPPAFDPDEIRAIVKEVVNFSKAGENPSFEPEHLRSVVLEAIASSGLREALASSSEVSDARATANTERFETELRLRTDAEARAKDLEKMLELSEKEIALYKENSVHVDRSIDGLRADKQASQDRISELEKTERDLRNRLSGQHNEMTALQSTLEEYRTSASRWRQEIDTARGSHAELQNTVQGLQQEKVERQQSQESLQEKMAAVARKFADERETSLKKGEEIRGLTNVIDGLKEKLQFAGKTHNADREVFRQKDEDAAKEISLLSSRLEEQMQKYHRLEQNLQLMAGHERNAIKATVQLEETRNSNARLSAEVQKLREENLIVQNDISMREREAFEAKDIARAEIQRSKTVLETELEVSRRRFEGVRNELETRLHHVREELKVAKRDVDQQRAEHARQLHEVNQSRTAAIREAAEQTHAARNDERTRFERHISDVARDHDMAMRRALDDHQRGEVHYREALKVKDDKVELLEEKCKHLEDKVTVAQSAAQAAATAAQQQQTMKAQNLESLRPSDRVSPQALRESIVVLQEQLQERESRIESLSSKNVELAKAAEAEKKLSAKDTEITWLRELLGVRVDDLSELVNMLSGEHYDKVAARDAAVRIRANLQMEQQEKERLIGQSNKAMGLPPSASGRPQGLGDQARETLRDVSNFASPRAAQLASAWGNWRRGGPTPSLSTLREAVATSSGTPRRDNRTISTSSTATDATQIISGNATAAQTFLSGLMTPPASNHIRRTPTPSSTLKGKGRDRQPSWSNDGHELDAQPLSLSLEDELEAAGGDEPVSVSPQMSPSRSRLSRSKTPQATAPISVNEDEDPLRSPLKAPERWGTGEQLDAGAAEHAVRSLEEEIGGIGDGDDIARDSVVSPLGPPEGQVGL